MDRRAHDAVAFIVRDRGCYPVLRPGKRPTLSRGSPPSPGRLWRSFAIPAVDTNSPLGDFQPRIGGAPPRYITSPIQTRPASLAYARRVCTPRFRLRADASCSWTLAAMNWSETLPEATMVRQAEERRGDRTARVGISHGKLDNSGRETYGQTFRVHSPGVTFRCVPWLHLWYAEGQSGADSGASAGDWVRGVSCLT